MLIRKQTEILSLMPTARWSRPDYLLGYLEEEESVALEPLLGSKLYAHLCDEYERLTEKYVDLTAITITPTGKSHLAPMLASADVTERLDAIQAGTYGGPHVGGADSAQEVAKEDYPAIRLIRICQQIEFYKMLSHKAGLLTVSFNDGGGMNLVSADGYEQADEKRMERLVKDAYMSAGRAVDTLLLFLEDDARGDKVFTEKWTESDSFYLHKDLLFTTARDLNEYLDIHGERAAYVALVRDIRFCQNTYLKPRVGADFLRGILRYVADKTRPEGSDEDVLSETVVMLRTALAFFVESRREEINGRKLSRADSMLDAQQAVSDACSYITSHLSSYGDIVSKSPLYAAYESAQVQAAAEASDAALAERRRKEECRERELRNTAAVFTGFPSARRWVTEERKP